MDTVRRYIGNCQICEGDFKATPGGVIALHGYERPGTGYIKGRCPGEGTFAYEKSNAMIPGMIAMYANMEEDLHGTLRAIDEGRVTSFVDDSYRKPREVTDAAPRWVHLLRDYRANIERRIARAAKDRAHYQKRYDDWRLLPLREVDELGRTPEMRAAQEARKSERLVARQTKEDKKAETQRKRGETLLKRKAMLDEAGKIIREAAARDDREAALRVLRELGKKKHASTLGASFIDDTIGKMKRYGVLAKNFPMDDDVTLSGYMWELDLSANDAMIRLGLAEPSTNFYCMNFKQNLWRVW